MSKFEANLIKTHENIDTWSSTVLRVIMRFLQTKNPAKVCFLLFLATIGLLINKSEDQKKVVYCIPIPMGTETQNSEFST